MNYTIKSNIGDITIGNKTLTSTPIDLVSIGITQIDYESFFNYSINDLTLYLNGNAVFCTPVVSRYIQYNIDAVPTDNIYLNEDLGI